ncbi:MAG TPA: alpha-amylase family glycosyl hydrolase [Bacilli bacterium]|nr:alpha-amylase family glycosyl hydrolase [Bacilli bacterium]
MGKRKVIASLALSALMGMGIILPTVFPVASHLEDDNAIYESPRTIDYEKPSMVSPRPAAITWPTSVTIHYHNDDGENSKRSFYFWFTGINGAEYPPDSITNEGKDMQIAFDFTSESQSQLYKKRMYMIVKVTGTWTGKSDDTYVDFASFPPDQTGLTEIWCIPGEGSSIEMYASQAETKMDKVVYAVFTDWKNISAIATVAPSTYRLYAFTTNYYRLNSAQQEMRRQEYLLTSGTAPATTPTTFNSAECQQFTIALNYTIHVNVQYVLEATFASNPGKWLSKNVAFDPLYETERFERFYNYDGDDLGVTYTAAATTFKVWAPTATRVIVMLYQSGIPSEYEGGNDTWGGYDMAYRPGGIWELTITGKDLNNRYYNYYVVNSLGSNEVVDPYAKACGVNGDRGMILNFDSINPTGWENIPLRWDGQENFDIDSPNELSIYEIHIRDLTSHASWNGTEEPGTYKAFYESGTHLATDTSVTTGFDHIEELGVKAIQILPVFDSDNDEVNYSFNWGYNPKNYNCVEGAYSSNPFNGASRVREFKSLVQAYANNANHTRVIMDVVYNHVSSAPASSFTKLMPKYYFRYSEGTYYYNGSGCGNEVRTEAPMMRKFIVESLVWWASEYKIKGFRFDLMGLIDTETLIQAATALYEIDPDIVLYGEGWRGDGGDFHGEGDAADTSNAYSKLFSTNSRLSVGAFNDTARNAMRGDNNPGFGFMQQGPADITSETRDKVAFSLWGIHYGKGANPSQTVNYVSCHDNYTLYDQLFATLGDGVNAPANSVLFNASIASHAFVMLSNGIAFMQGGEELFRTKVVDPSLEGEILSDTYHTFYGINISHNSYNSPDSVNTFDWTRKVSVDGQDTSQYTAKFAEAIKLHSSLPKYAYSATAFPYTVTSAGNPIFGISWAGSEKGSSSPQTYQGCAGFQLDEYFVFLSGRQWGWVQFGDVGISQKIYESGEFTYDSLNGTVNLGNYASNTGGSIVVFYRGVKK